MNFKFSYLSLLIFVIVLSIIGLGLYNLLVGPKNDDFNFSLTDTKLVNRRGWDDHAEYGTKIGPFRAEYVFQGNPEESVTFNYIDDKMKQKTIYLPAIPGSEYLFVSFQNRAGAKRVCVYTREIEGNTGR